MFGWFSKKRKVDFDALSERDRERYKRNIIVREWRGEEGQLKLKRSKVLVAGAGGSGSALLYYLAAAGVGTIRVCDGDRVTLGNLNRQILYGDGSIGKVKAKEAKRALERLNPDIAIEAHPKHIDEGSIDSLIDGCDIVCCAVDDKKAMRLLGRKAFEKGIPLVWAGGYYMGGFLSFVNPPVTPCLECILEIIDTAEQRVRDGKLPMREDITLEVEGQNPVVGAAAGAAGAMQAMEAIKHLVGFGGSYLGVLLEFQMGGMGFEFRQVDIDHLRRKGCSICNPQ